MKMVTTTMQASTAFEGDDHDDGYPVDVPPAYLMFAAIDK